MIKILDLQAPAFFRRGIAKQLLQYVLEFPHITDFPNVKAHFGAIAHPLGVG
ncbi:hypothetical protein [Rubeoparvulum massiliense]|uniref:hypothetical protein n=1 Tax=Rubeoparvulum massiliense TaxID=1631346 RepID=UPI0012E0B876|nr:hypothetical protein [Rubeoparvulum massiliense]